MTALDVLKKAASLMSGETRSQIRGLIDDLGLTFTDIQQIEVKPQNA